MSLRYFLYISDAKIDVLLPQVPGTTQQKVAARLGFDLKVLSGSIATERETYDTRVARLRTVETHVLEKEHVGTPENPMSWIQGEAMAKFVDLGEGGILFVMEGEGWLLALGGSAKHIVGDAKPERVHVPMSFAPNLAERLRYLTEKKAHILTGLPEGTLNLTTKAQGFSAWADLIHAARDLSTNPPQRIKFLAKRLASDQDHGKKVTLASPLYVEQADDEG